MTNVIPVPAERWEELADINSCMAGASFDPVKGKPLAVKSDVYLSHRYTAFGTLYGPWSETKKPTIWAYRLVPLALYRGETTIVYHDAEAIAEGRRQRGDHTGLIVSVAGQHMVCEDRVNLEMALPRCRPLTLSEARAWHQDALVFNGAAFHGNPVEVSWHAYEGHPVIRYHREGGTRTALLWSVDGQHVVEMWLAKEVRPTSAETLLAQDAPPVVVGAQGQIGLF